MAIHALQIIDDWRRKQYDLPGRPEAIRRLVEIGLASGRYTSAKLDQRAVKNASRVIDAMAADLKAKN
jgi:hypothetical protein